MSPINKNNKIRNYKVAALIGSHRKMHTYKSVEIFLTNLQSYGNVEYEIIRLSEYNLKVCRGCKLCTDKGEEYCPLEDDRDRILEKMNNCDGIVFAAPNYSFHVSAQMKLFLDRLAFVFHRPSFFGKTFTSIVPQGIYGGGKIVNYFNFIGKAMGFNVVKGVCLTTLEPITEKVQKKNSQVLEKLSRRFYNRLQKNKFPVPSLFDLFIFRMSRSRIKSMLDENFRDFSFYREKGWFESDFFYPVKLNPLIRLTGFITDKLISDSGGKGY